MARGGKQGRCLPLAAALVMLGWAAGAQGPASDVVPEARIVLQADADLPGNDLAMIRQIGQEACVQACLANDGCEALTWNARARACFLKAQPAEPIAFGGAQSGIRVATDDAVLARASEKLANAPWITAEDRRQMSEQAGRLGTLYPGDIGSGAADLRALAALAADGEARIRWLGATVAASDLARDWAALAVAMDQAAGSIGGERNSQLRRSAALAALNGWLRDAGPGTEALRLWVRLAEEDGRGRDALQAIRLAAEAEPANADLATEREGYEERHGFRVTGSRADADGTRPRVCASFSEPLARQIDLRPFVQLPDPALAVEVEGHDLCITGAPRGAVLRFALRAGLPSDDGETLRRTVQQAQYVRDRAPLVRFAGRAYVLPATGDQGLAVTTVNTDRVDLTLYRMSDRNIVRALGEGLFAAPLDDWKADRFADGMGTETWRGQMDVASPTGGGERPVNAEVASRIDLRQAGLSLDPGVYVLNAAVPGQSTDRSPRASQWFMISDLGLTTFQGSDGLTVAVRGLGDAAARPGVEVQLVSRGNAVLGTAMTDAEGVARFDAGLVRGTGAAAPGIVTATRREGDRIADLAFLSLLDPEFDLSDRGVEGAPPAPPIDLFVALDRGAYRAGETAHATVLARDGRARALDGLPVQARVIRPDGVEHARLAPRPAGAGGHILDVAIPANAPRGAWRIDLRVEEDGPPLASARMLVEDFRPERIDFDLVLPDGVLPADRPVEAGFDARWLFGAPAAGLPVEGELRLSPARSLPGWEGYVFGRHDDAGESDVVGMPAGRTDDAGRFSARIDLPPGVKAAARPWEATLVLSVREGAGRPVERRTTRILAPGRAAPGIRPDFEGGSVAEGATAGFRIVTLGRDLTPVADDLEWTLNRVRTDYQWFAIGGDWNWEPVTRRDRLDGGTLAAMPGGPATLAVPVDWGSYELVVRTRDGAESSILFDAGWGAAGAGSDTPDRLRVTLDKPAYRPGETARLTLEAAADGVALVSVLSNRLIALQSVPVTAGRNEVALPVTDDWDAGVYVAASAIRPLTEGAGHAPVRALGIAPAAVDPGDRVLTATLTTPAESGPRGSAPVTLAVEGAQPGQAVHATLWAVDQGILNLTGYQPPSATAHYFGQRRLGVGLRDLYGRLILPSGAADGALRSGGDAGSMQMQAPPPTERLMAWFSGPLVLDEEGRATVAVPLPDFNGEVRVMAVAWTEGAVGQADATMLVRDPVVVTATVPAFLAPGDRAEAQIRLTHAAGPAGDVGLSIDNAAEVALATDLAPQVTLAERQTADLPLVLTAPDAQGLAQLRLSAGLPGGTTVTKDLSIPVERLDPSVTRAMRLTLAPGEALPLDLSPLGDFRPGTGRVTLSTGAFAALDMPGAIAQLAEWPYGCSEQLASAAMPLLFAAGLAPEGAPSRPDDARAVDKAIAQILTRQTPEGGFGLWSAEPGDRWLDAYLTDFLSRARAAGHAVPEAAFRNALSALQNGLNAAPDPQFADPGDNAATAYAAYVLARERAAVVSDLRYYADTGAEHLASPLAAAQLGAALAALGDQPRADALFRRAQALSDMGAARDAGFRSDYGALLRDRAGMLALAAEAGSQAVDHEGTVAAISAALDGSEGRLSTQEAAWIVLAGQALTAGPDAGRGLALNGAPLSSPSLDLGEAGAVPETTLTNTGDAPLAVTVSATAVPVGAEPAGGTAFGISRSYYTPEGEPVDPARVARGTRLVAVVEIRPFDASGGRLIVTDPLPAGFEIDNPNLLTQADLGGLDWLELTEWADMTEFRQDRFAAAVTSRDDRPIRMAYRLRAVTAGDFAHPAATVADMYRPERRGWTGSGRAIITP
ncbi:alpha-2-macroglobulin family protein [Paracoccus sp. (in: a-proteobacteria)]|uniref:alpha-2-macroglobulin family protein n=1 Tax=Paracoccus sp. TaxID=267 RepID=UPI0035B24CF5